MRRATVATAVLLSAAFSWILFFQYTDPGRSLDVVATTSEPPYMLHPGWSAPPGAHPHPVTFFSVEHKAGHFMLAMFFWTLHKNVLKCADAVQPIWNTLSYMALWKLKYPTGWKDVPCVVCARLNVKGTGFRGNWRKYVSALQQVANASGSAREWPQKLNVSAALLFGWDDRQSLMEAVLLDEARNGYSIQPPLGVIRFVRDPRTLLLSARAYHVDNCAENPFPLSSGQALDELLLAASKVPEKTLREELVALLRAPRAAGTPVCEVVQRASRRAQFALVAWESNLFYTLGTRNNRLRAGTMFIRFEDLMAQPFETAAAWARYMQPFDEKFQEQFASTYVRVVEWSRSNVNISAGQLRGHAHHAPSSWATASEEDKQHVICTLHGLTPTMGDLYSAWGYEPLEPCTASNGARAMHEISGLWKV